MRIVTALFLLIVGCIQCTTSTAQSPWQRPLVESLPADYRASVLWSANHEAGDLHEWDRPDAKYPGGGVLNTGPDDQIIARASQTQAFTGKFSAEATIHGAIRARNGKRAVRLMRWTDKPWDKGGGYFPKVAFYSTWMFVPHKYSNKKRAPWDPGDGGWWNVFQFKANDADETSIPTWSLNLHFNEQKDQMEFGLYSEINEPRSVDAAEPTPVPVGRWFHVEARLEVSATNTGRIDVWQDGKLLMTAANVKTAITPKNENAVWGIGNYTDHIAGGPVEGSATLYFDDAIISSKPMYEAIAKMDWIKRRSDKPIDAAAASSQPTPPTN